MANSFNIYSEPIYATGASSGGSLVVTAPCYSIPFVSTNSGSSISIDSTPGFGVNFDSFPGLTINGPLKLNGPVDFLKDPFEDLKPKWESIYEKQISDLKDSFAEVFKQLSNFGKIEENKKDKEMSPTEKMELTQISYYYKLLNVMMNEFFLDINKIDSLYEDEVLAPADKPKASIKWKKLSNGSYRLDLIGDKNLDKKSLKSIFSFSRTSVSPYLAISRVYEDIQLEAADLFS